MSEDNDFDDGPWSVLGIVPTNDVKTIKRAYAKNLKKTKPDENPAGFQRLNEAYKTACYLAENYDIVDTDIEGAGAGQTEAETYNRAKTDSGDEADSIQGYDVSESADGRLFVRGKIETPTEPIEVTEPAEIKEPEKDSKPSSDPDEDDIDDEDSDDEDFDLEQAYSDKAEEVDGYAEHALMQQLLGQVDDLLKKYPDYHDPQNWRFLLEHEEIFDIDFSHALAFYVLLKVVQHNQRYIKIGNKYKWIRGPVLAMLDAHMYWRRDIDFFLSLAQAMENRNPDKKEKPISPAGIPDAISEAEDSSEKKLLKNLAAIPGGEEYDEFYTLCMEEEITVVPTRTRSVGEGGTEEESGGLSYEWMIWAGMMILWLIYKYA